MDTSDFEKMEVEGGAGSDRLVFHNSVPELVKLTCFRLTLDLWSCSLQDPSDDLNNTFKNRIDDLIKKLGTNVSDLTRNTITWYSKRILKLSSMWVTYHKKHVFKDWDIELISGICFPELIWRSDGSIDNLKSAEALIKSSNLGDEQEFRLVCLYCMDDRIVDMWSRLADSQCVSFDVFFDEEVSLLAYWNNRMAGYFSNSGMKSAENRLIANEAIDNLSAAVYFFDHFTTEERVEKGCQLIPCVKLDERAEYVKTILSKFDKEELHRSFQLHCSDIMYPLIMNCGYDKFAFEVWNRVKNLLTIQSFLSIMSRITATLRVAFKNPDRRFIDELDDYNDFKRNIFDIIGDLWTISPNWLKTHDLTSSIRGVIYTLAKYYVRMKIDWDPEARFLSKILSNASYSLSHHFFFTFFSKLVNVFRLDVIRDLIKVTRCHRFRLFYREKKAKGMFRAKNFVKLEEYLEACQRGRISRNVDRYFLMLALLGTKNPMDLFIDSFELDNDEIEYLRKFFTCLAEEFPNDVTRFKQKYYSYCPRLWLEPIEMNYELACYSGLECL